MKKRKDIEKETITLQDFKILSILMSFLVVYMVLGTVTSQKIIDIGSISLPVVCIWFSLLTFPITDVICNEFGKKYANFSIVVSWIAMGLTTIMANISAHLPASNSFQPYEEAFRFLMTNSTRFFLVVSIAFFASQYLDNELFSYLKDKTSGKHLWIRNNVSTIISQVVNTLLFVFGMYLGNMSFQRILNIFWGTVLVKIIIAFLDTPLVYGGVYLVRKIRKGNLQHESK